MEIQFLGTSSGVPTRSRNVSATAIKAHHKKSWLLVDCGEGTQHQILRTKLSLQQLQAIMITHVHGDHCFGLPGLLASAALSGRREPLTLVGPAAIKTWIDCAQQISDTYLTYPIDFIALEDLPGLLAIDSFTITSHPLSHRVLSHAYAIEERDTAPQLDREKLQAMQIPAGPVWGQLQQGQDVTLSNGQTLRSEDFLLPARKPRRIIVGGDNDQPKLLKQAAANCDLLIHEATFTSVVAEKVGTGPQHSCAKRVAQFAAEAQVPNLILTHFSARYQDTPDATTHIDEIALEAQNHYSGTLFLANDFDRFHLQQDGRLVRLVS